MTRIADIARFLDAFTPARLAEDWDNVGLLVGDTARPVSSVMTCLTLTEDVAQEAIVRNANLVVSHHPLLFRPVQRITADTAEGRTLLALIEAGIAVYSPHTGYDSAREGINQQLAQKLELADVAVLHIRLTEIELAGGAVSASQENSGGGRYGELAVPMPLGEFMAHVKSKLGLAQVQYAGDLGKKIERVGIACGSAAEFLADAHRLGCHAFVTGEARFHSALEARSLGIALVLIGHYASERPGVVQLAKVIGTQFSDLTVWASADESDPLDWS